jgi:hypothetical protein
MRPPRGGRQGGGSVGPRSSVKSTDIPLARLAAQAVTRPLASPVAVVRHLLAAQAQDYAGTKWAVALRVAKPTRDADLERCFDDGTIVRTHALRGTWQLVLPADLRWLLALGRDRVLARSRRRFEELGLDRSTLKKANGVIERTLAGGQHRTRAELQAALDRARVGTTQERLSHILLNAELSEIAVSGARRGKQTTHVAFDERIPTGQRLTRDESLALLAGRYFTSRGPATVADLSWWAGLEPKEARQAVEAAAPALAHETWHGSVHYFAKALRVIRPSRPIELLPGFDEYLVAYRKRDAVLDPEQARRVNAGGGMLDPCVVEQGRVVGTWRRELGKTAVDIELDWFARATREQRAAGERAAERYAAFVGFEASVAHAASVKRAKK